MLLAWGMDLVYILMGMAWMFIQASAYDCRMGWIENVLFQKNSFFSFSLIRQLPLKCDLMINGLLSASYVCLYMLVHAMKITRYRQLALQL